MVDNDYNQDLTVLDRSHIEEENSQLEHTENDKTTNCNHKSMTNPGLSKKTRSKTSHKKATISKYYPE